MNKTDLPYKMIKTETKTLCHPHGDIVEIRIVCDVVWNGFEGEIIWSEDSNYLKSNPIKNSFVWIGLWYPKWQF